MDRSSTVSLLAALAIFVVLTVGLVQILVKRRNPELILLAGLLVIAGIVAVGVPIANPEVSASPTIIRISVLAAVVLSVSLVLRLLNRWRRK